MRDFWSLIILIIREGHFSWASPSGVILMGGYSSPKTTEKIQQDGTSSYSLITAQNILVKKFLVKCHSAGTTL